MLKDQLIRPMLTFGILILAPLTNSYLAAGAVSLQQPQVVAVSDDFICSKVSDGVLCTSVSTKRHFASGDVQSLVIGKDYRLCAVLKVDQTKVCWDMRTGESMRPPSPDHFYVKQHVVGEDSDCKHEEGDWLICRQIHGEEYWSFSISKSYVVRVVSNSAQCGTDDGNWSCTTLNGSKIALPSTWNTADDLALVRNWVCAAVAGKVECQDLHPEWHLDIPLAALPPADLVGVKSLHAGRYSQLCARVETGLRCWGANIGRVNDLTIYESETALPSRPERLFALPKLLCMTGSFGLGCWNNLKLRFDGFDLLWPNAHPELVTGDNDYLCWVEGGLVTCAGKSQGLGELTPPDGLTGIKEMASDGGTTCVIADQGLQCWGRRSSSSLDVRLPARLTNPRDLFTNAAIGCVRGDEGIRCWQHPDSRPVVAARPERWPGWNPDDAIPVASDAKYYTRNPNEGRVFFYSKDGKILGWRPDQTYIMGQLGYDDSRSWIDTGYKLCLWERGYASVKIDTIRCLTERGEVPSVAMKFDWMAAGSSVPPVFNSQGCLLKENPVNASSATRLACYRFRFSPDQYYRLDWSYASELKVSPDRPSWAVHEFEP